MTTTTTTLVYSHYLTYDITLTTRNNGSEKQHTPCMGGLPVANVWLFGAYSRAKSDEDAEIHGYTYMNHETNTIHIQDDQQGDE